MTSRPPQGSSTTSTRRIGKSRLRRATQIVLVVGTLLALAAAVVPFWVPANGIWLVRAGVVVAIAAGILACALAWRELFWERRQHAKAMLAASHEHGSAMSAERRRNADVVDALSERIHSAGQVISGQRVTIAELRTEVSSLHGDKAHLVGEIQQRDGVLGALRDTVRARETELAALRLEEEAEVRHMPRRMLAEDESAWVDVPAADDLWTDGTHPTVVDMKSIDPKTLETAMVPPYEARRVG